MKSSGMLHFDDTETAFRYQSDKALKKARLLFGMMRHGWLVRLASWLAPLALRLHLPVRGLIKHSVFGLFCGGETLEEAAETARRLSAFGVGVTLDYGVEAAGRQDRYDETAAEFIRAVGYAASRPAIPFISLKMTALADFSLLEKAHRGALLSAAEKAAFARAGDRLEAICARASLGGTGVLIDAEESWIQRAVDSLAARMMRRFNGSRAVVYNTYQLYLQSRPGALCRAWQDARQAGYLLGAKLVRGAYLEKEAAYAAEAGRPPAIQPSKQATDDAFDQALRFCVDRLEDLALFIGTHNEASCRLAAHLLDEKGLPPDHPRVHFSQLFGMSDAITFNLATAGYRVSKYLPYGPISQVMPYLLRRARENSAVTGQLGREEHLIDQELRRRNLL